MLQILKGAFEFLKGHSEQKCQLIGQLKTFISVVLVTEVEIFLSSKLDEKIKILNRIFVFCNCIVTLGLDVTNSERGF
jgi:hypothetical protein